MSGTDILKSLAPLIGTAVAGPLGGVAVKWLADKIGVEEQTVEAVTSALQGKDPTEIAAIQNDFNKWFIVESNRMIELQMKDVQDARARDAKLQADGKHNLRADSMFILAVIVVSAVFYAIWSSPDLNEFVKGVATLILGRFLGYLDNIYNFEFGTTRGSQDKNTVIKNLTRD